mgnify:CR=1 FL=1
MSYFYIMLERFNEYRLRRDLIKKGEVTLLAVSGGVDSVCLVHLFAAARLPFAIAHCNFQLRGEASDADEQLVKALAAELGVPFYVKHFETEHVAAAQQVSIQMAARELRYRWFQELMEAEKYQKLATAHHLNDSVETSLFNLAKGTGIAGLRGMLPKTNTVIRPMLFATKPEIYDYAREARLRWREDVSNESLKYQRNFVRGKIVPLLHEINPAFESTFHETMDRLALAEAALKQHLAAVEEKYVTKNEGVISIDLEVLQSAHGYTLLFELIREYGFSLRQCKDISKSVAHSGSRFLSAGYILVKDRTHLILTRKDSDRREVLINEGDATVDAGSSSFFCETLQPPLTLNGTPEIAMLDRDKLQFPLQVRDWRPGERFVPLGMKGKKKISDFMIDCKIPLNLKSSYQVLTSGEEIVWLIGLRIDDRYKLRADTARIFKIKVTKDHV